MAYKMTKRGSMDNQTANEFFCDTINDRNAIPSADINLGTIAIVLKPGMQVFIADSNKEWHAFGASGDSDNANSPIVDQGQADSMTLQG